MGDASFIQTNFLGGEWSPYAQGRADDERYRSAMNVCYNAFPVEEGAWTRRSGTRFVATTRKGAPGALRQFFFTQNHPYNMEFTDGHLRFVSGAQLVQDNPPVSAVAISSASPAVVTTGLPTAWATGDEVEFSFPTGLPRTGIAPLFNRQFEIIVSDSTHFSIHDPVTGAAIDGSTINLGATPITVTRVTDFPTVYTAGSWANNRVVQNETVAMILNPAFKPYALTSQGQEDTAEDVFATFALNAAKFLDGPYMDPPTDGSTLTPSATTGTITLVASAITSINGGFGFKATDVGRAVRLYSEPADWSAVTAYAVGDFVKFNNGYYQALAANNGKEPDTDVTNWIVTESAAAWTWGTIGTFTDFQTVHITLAATDPTGEFAGGPLMNTHPIKTWRLGKYSDTTGWPSAGCYHENRFWLTNVANQFDASVSNGDSVGNDGTPTFNFCPTGPDGTVADNNGISEAIKSTDVNTIFWLQPDHSGVILGTQGGEWLIQASSLNDPLTPTSIQAHRVTKYGCANIEPRRTGLSNVFVHRYNRKIMEYVADVYSGKFSGTNLSKMAKHVAITGIEEIAYVQEIVPIVWARMGDGSLAGCTYRRESPFGTQPANFSGWHRQALGSGRLVESIQAGPSVGGDLDSLLMVTNDPATGIRFIEIMVDVFDEDTPLTQAWFVDGAVTPTVAQIVGTNVVLYGLEYIEGKTVSVVGGGLDLGDYVVTGGTITVPLAVANALFTESYLATLTSENSTFGGLGVSIIRPDTGNFQVPTAGSCLEYTPGAGLTGVSAVITVPDWHNSVAYMIKAGNGTTNGIRRFSLLTGAETGNVSASALFSADASQFVQNPMCVDVNGNLYFSATSSNAGTLRRVKGSTLGLTGTFGIDSNALTTSATYLQKPRSLAAVEADDTYILSSSLVGDSGLSGKIGISAINGTQMQFAGFLQDTGRTYATVATGPSFTEGGRRYGVGYVLAADSPNDESTTSFDILRVVFEEGAASYSAASEWPSTPNPYIHIEAVATIADSAFSMSHFNYIRGLCLDQSDGNLLMFVGNDDPVSYFCKINAQTGAVMWKTAVDAVPAPDNMNVSRVSVGRYGFLSSHLNSTYYNYYLFNTADGSLVQTLHVIGVQSGSAEAYDDVTGQLIFYGNFTSGAGTPTGTSFSGEWGTLDPANGIRPPGGRITNQTYFAPFAIGFTYTSDGQILRPLAQQEAGSRSGPALAMTRREHQFGALMHRTRGISFGVDFDHLNPALFASSGGTIYTDLQLWSGIWWNSLDADYDFDNMACWRITRPMPATMLMLGNFLHTQDR